MNRSFAVVFRLAIVIFALAYWNLIGRLLWTTGFFNVSQDGYTFWNLPNNIGLLIVVHLFALVAVMFSWLGLWLIALLIMWIANGLDTYWFDDYFYQVLLIPGGIALIAVPIGFILA